MEPRDITIEILISIRDEVRATNARFDALSERVDGTNTRLDGVNRRLDSHERRFVEMTREMRQAFESADKKDTGRIRVGIYAYFEDAKRELDSPEPSPPRRPDNKQ